MSKEPLFPHVPKGKEPLYPHQAKSQNPKAPVTPEVTVKFGKGISPKAQSSIQKLIDDLPLEIKTNIRSIELDEPYIERMSRLHKKTYDGYFDHATGKLGFRNIEVATNPKSFYHELGHAAFQSKFDAHDLELFANYIALVEKDKPLAELVRAGKKPIDELPLGLWEDMADDFADYCISPAWMREEYPKYARFFEKHFPMREPVAIPTAEAAKERRQPDSKVIEPFNIHLRAFWEDDMENVEKLIRKLDTNTLKKLYGMTIEVTPGQFFSNPRTGEPMLGDTWYFHGKPYLILLGTKPSPRVVYHEIAHAIGIEDEELAMKFAIEQEARLKSTGIWGKG